MTIKVIGAGFGRTGTDSMREALTILGFGPATTCSKSWPTPNRSGFGGSWRWAPRPTGTGCWRAYSSCMDWPSAHYWRDLVEFYPQARVVLTWRSAESWWASFEKTILTAIAETVDQELLGITLVARQVFGGRPHDRAHAISVYEANVKAVIATVPAERLAGAQAGRWMGAAVRPSRPSGAGPALPQPQQHGRVPGISHAMMRRAEAAQSDSRPLALASPTPVLYQSAMSAARPSAPPVRPPWRPRPCARFPPPCCFSALSAIAGPAEGAPGGRRAPHAATAPCQSHIPA